MFFSAGQVAASSSSLDFFRERLSAHASGRDPAQLAPQAWLDFAADPENTFKLDTLLQVLTESSNISYTSAAALRGLWVRESKNLAVNYATKILHDEQGPSLLEEAAMLPGLGGLGGRVPMPPPAFSDVAYNASRAAFSGAVEVFPITTLAEESALALLPEAGAGSAVASAEIIAPVLVMLGMSYFLFADFGGGAREEYGQGDSATVRDPGGLRDAPVDAGVSPVATGVAVGVLLKLAEGSGAPLPPPSPERLPPEEKAKRKQLELPPFQLTDMREQAGTLKLELPEAEKNKELKDPEEKRVTIGDAAEERATIGDQEVDGPKKDPDREAEAKKIAAGIIDPQDALRQIVEEEEDESGQLATALRKLSDDGNVAAERALESVSVDQIPVLEDSPFDAVMYRGLAFSEARRQLNALRPGLGDELLRNAEKLQTSKGGLQTFLQHSSFRLRNEGANHPELFPFLYLASLMEVKTARDPSKVAEWVGYLGLSYTCMQAEVARREPGMTPERAALVQKYLLYMFVDRVNPIDGKVINLLVDDVLGAVDAEEAVHAVNAVPEPIVEQVPERDGFDDLLAGLTDLFASRPEPVKVAEPDVPAPVKTPVAQGPVWWSQFPPEPIVLSVNVPINPNYHGDELNNALAALDHGEIDTQSFLRLAASVGYTYDDWRTGMGQDPRVVRFIRSVVVNRADLYNAARNLLAWPELRNASLLQSTARGKLYRAVNRLVGAIDSGQVAVPGGTVSVVPVEPRPSNWPDTVFPEMWMDFATPVEEDNNDWLTPPEPILNVPAVRARNALAGNCVDVALIVHAGSEVHAQARAFAAQVGAETLTDDFTVAVNDFNRVLRNPKRTNRDVKSAAEAVLASKLLQRIAAEKTDFVDHPDEKLTVAELTRSAAQEYRDLLKNLLDKLFHGVEFVSEADNYSAAATAAERGTIDVPATLRLAEAARAQLLAEDGAVPAALEDLIRALDEDPVDHDCMDRVLYAFLTSPLSSAASARPSSPVGQLEYLLNRLLDVVSPAELQPGSAWAKAAPPPGAGAALSALKVGGVTWDEGIRQLAAINADDARRLQEAALRTDISLLKDLLANARYGRFSRPALLVFRAAALVFADVEGPLTSETQENWHREFTKIFFAQCSAWDAYHNAVQEVAPVLNEAQRAQLDRFIFGVVPYEVYSAPRKTNDERVEQVRTWVSNILDDQPHDLEPVAALPIPKPVPASRQAVLPVVKDPPAKAELELPMRGVTWSDAIALIQGFDTAAAEQLAQLQPEAPAVVRYFSDAQRILSGRDRHVQVPDLILYLSLARCAVNGQFNEDEAIDHLGSAMDEYLSSNVDDLSTLEKLDVAAVRVPLASVQAVASQMSEREILEQVDIIMHVDVGMNYPFDATRKIDVTKMNSYLRKISRALTEQTETSQLTTLLSRILTLSAERRPSAAELRSVLADYVRWYGDLPGYNDPVEPTPPPAELAVETPLVDEVAGFDSESEVPDDVQPWAAYKRVSRFATTPVPESVAAVPVEQNINAPFHLASDIEALLDKKGARARKTVYDFLTRVKGGGQFDKHDLITVVEALGLTPIGGACTTHMRYRLGAKVIGVKKGTGRVADGFVSDLRKFLTEEGVEYNQHVRNLGDDFTGK